MKLSLEEITEKIKSLRLKIDLQTQEISELQKTIKNANPEVNKIFSSHELNESTVLETAIKNLKGTRRIILGSRKKDLIVLNTQLENKNKLTENQKELEKELKKLEKLEKLEKELEKLEKLENLGLFLEKCNEFQTQKEIIDSNLNAWDKVFNPFNILKDAIIIPYTLGINDLQGRLLVIEAQLKNNKITAKKKDQLTTQKDNLQKKHDQLEKELYELPKEGNLSPLKGIKTPNLKDFAQEQVNLISDQSHKLDNLLNVVLPIILDKIIDCNLLTAIANYEKLTSTPKSTSLTDKASEDIGTLNIEKFSSPHNFVLALEQLLIFLEARIKKLQDNPSNSESMTYEINEALVTINDSHEILKTHKALTTYLELEKQLQKLLKEKTSLKRLIERNIETLLEPNAKSEIKNIKDLDHQYGIVGRSHIKIQALLIKINDLDAKLTPMREQFPKNKINDIKKDDLKEELTKSCRYIKRCIENYEDLRESRPKSLSNIAVSPSDRGQLPSPSTSFSSDNGHTSTTRQAPRSPKTP